MPAETTVTTREGISGCLAFTLPNQLSPAVAEQTLAHWQQQLRQRLAQHGGELDVLQPHVFWIFFADDEPALALRRCLKSVWPLLTKPVLVQGHPVLIELGLARGSQGNPYGARNLARPDQRCILPEALGYLLPPGLATQPVATDNGYVALALPAITAPQPVAKPIATPAIVEPTTMPVESTVAPAETLAPTPPASSMASVAAMASASHQHVAPSLNEPMADTDANSTETGMALETSIPTPASSSSDHSAADTSPKPSIASLFDIPVEHYAPPHLTPPTAAPETSTSAMDDAFAITAPSSPPTIPDVVHQRFSVPLPQEPAASGLPVFSDISRHATGLGAGVASTGGLSRPNAAAATPYPRRPEEMGLSYSAPQWFQPATTLPTPTHTYTETAPALLQTVQTAMQPGDHSRIVTVTGPTGIGKTAWLTHGLLQQLVPDPQAPSVIWFAAQAAATVSDATQPLGLWRDLLQRAVPIPPEGADTEQLRKWVQQSLDQVFAGDTDPDHYHVFEWLLGVAQPLSSEPTLEDIATPALLAQFFARMSAQMPVVIVLDDLHRADAASVSLLTAVWDALPRDAQVVWVLGWNTDEAEPSLGLTNALTNAHKLSTHGLDAHAIENLFTHGPFQSMRAALTSPLLNQLRDHALSNGQGLLYVSEVMTWLHAQGMVQMAGDSQQIQANPEVDQQTVQLPAALEAIYQARMTWLSPEQQEVLAWAAVLGERFSLQLLSVCCPLTHEAFQQALQGLAAQQWLLTDFQQTAQFRHPSLYQFVHAQLADTSPRRAQVARHLAELRQQGMAVPPSLQAYFADTPAEARAFWMATATMAGQLGSLTGLSHALAQAGEQLFHEAQQYSTSTVPNSLIAEEMHLKTRLAQANMVEHPDVAAHVLPPVVAFHQHQGNAPALVETLASLMVAFERIGHLRGALDVLDNCLQQVDNDGADTQTWAALQAQRATILHQMGQLGATAHILQEPLVQQLLSQSTGTAVALNRLRDKVARTQAGLVWQQLYPQPMETIEAQLRQVSPAAQVGLRLEAAQAALLTGQFAEAQGLLEHSLPLIEQQEQQARYLGQWGLVTLRLYRAQGNRAEAEPLILPSLQQAELAHDYPTWILLNLEAAYLSLNEGNATTALDIAERMAHEASERQLAQCALESWQVMAQAMRTQQPEQASAVLEKALQVAEKPNISHHLKKVELTLALADVHLAQGELQAASGLLQPLWPLLKDSHYQIIVRRGAGNIAALYEQLAKRQPDAAKRAQQEERAQAFRALVNP